MTTELKRALYAELLDIVSHDRNDPSITSAEMLGDIIERLADGDDAVIEAMRNLLWDRGRPVTTERVRCALAAGMRQVMK